MNDERDGPNEKPEPTTRRPTHFHRNSRLPGGQDRWEYIDVVDEPPSLDSIDVLVVYARPREHPDKYVVRRWAISGSDRWIDPKPVAICDTLTAARHTINPPPRYNVGRCNEEDPEVFEIWL